MSQQTEVPLIEKVRFQKRRPEDFYATVKQRVEAYFKTKTLSHHANGAMVFKSLVLNGLLLFLYLLLISNFATSWGILLLYAGIGSLIGLIGFNMTHDALHGAYSSKRWLNRLLGYAFDLGGTSSFVWKTTHNVYHHTYTNIPGIDEDIDKAIWLRLSPTDKLYSFHAYQHWYAPFLYAFTTVNWVLYSDYVWFNRERKRRSIDRDELVLFYLFKVINLLLFLVIPLFVLQAPWWMIILGFFCMHFGGGLSIAFIFQLAHVVEGVKYPEPDENGKMANPWAIHELLTTSNFATDSLFVTHLVGGLNFQIEHHLFPYMCHVHYPEISKIVREAAYEFEVPYLDQPTLWMAFKSHFRRLRQLGRGEPV